MNCRLKFAVSMKLKIFLTVINIGHSSIFCIFSGLILIPSLLTIYPRYSIFFMEFVFASFQPEAPTSQCLEYLLYVFNMLF